ncbi:MAG: hypothetical protein KF784_03865 [Fimbriimonadaceae bacterium]|nr:hypothetical protein [Fimbriimonadaceae bacterium]
MRKGLCLIASAAVAALIFTGCGGSSGSSAPAVFPVTRLVVGFVYVEGTAGSGTGDSVIISPSSVPPAGYFVPDATGSVTLAVADGTITRSPDSETFFMSDGNVIAATVTQNVAPYQMTISATGLQRNGVARSFGSAQIQSLGTTVDNGTTLALDLNDPGTYTPGPTASIRLWLRNRGGNPGTSAAPFHDPETATGGDWIGGNTYDTTVAFFDEEGTAKSGITPTVVTDDNTRLTYAANKLTAVAAQTSATVVVTVSEAPGAPVSLSYDADYTQGTVTSIALQLVGSPTLLWEESGGSVNGSLLSANVMNQYGAPMAGLPVDWRAVEVEESNTLTHPAVWNTTSVGSVFSGVDPATNAGGDAGAVLQTPNPVDGALAGGDKAPKGVNRVAAFIGAVVSNTQDITIVRPLESVTIVGPARIDVGTTTPSNILDPQNIRITNGVDVDNDNVATPTGPFVWDVVNVDNSGNNIGDNGDLTTQSTSASAISGSATGSSIQLAAGTVAGQVTVQVTDAGGNPLPTASNMLTIEVFGKPSKLIYRANDVSGAQIVNGAGAFAGNNGDIFNFTTRFLDSAGHEIPTGELSLSNKLGSTDSLSGANITFPSLPSRTFSLTLGSADGTTTITFSGSWIGLFGGSGAFNINRTTNLDVP